MVRCWTVQKEGAAHGSCSFAGVYPAPQAFCAPALKPYVQAASPLPISSFLLQGGDFGDGESWAAYFQRVLNVPLGIATVCATVLAIIQFFEWLESYATRRAHQYVNSLKGDEKLLTQGSRLLSGCRCIGMSCMSRMIPTCVKYPTCVSGHVHLVCVKALALCYWCVHTLPHSSSGSM